MNLNAHLRREFYRQLLRGLRFVWPVLAGLVVVLIGLGMAVSLLEGWPLLDGIYFAFVTGLTVGYGDLVPSHVTSRILAIAAAIDGILLTALLAGVAVRAMQNTASDMPACD
jgi:Ion channel